MTSRSRNDCAITLPERWDDQNLEFVGGSLGMAFIFILELWINCYYLSYTDILVWLLYARGTQWMHWWITVSALTTTHCMQGEQPAHPVIIDGLTRRPSGWLSVRRPWVRWAVIRVIPNLNHRRYKESWYWISWKCLLINRPGNLVRDTESRWDS